MSDVFYLDVPRIRSLRGVGDAGAGNVNGGVTGCGFNLPVHDTLSKESFFGGSINISWRVLPLTVGVLSAGCALFIGVRLWLYWREHSSTSSLFFGKLSSRSKKQRQRGLLRQRRRVVVDAGMVGISAVNECNVNIAPGNTDVAILPAHHIRNIQRTSDNSDTSEMYNYDDSVSSTDEIMGLVDKKHESSSVFFYEEKDKLNNKEKTFFDGTKMLPHSQLEFVTSDGERYKRVSRLGRGGFGTVFKCINLSTGQFVAVKEVRLGGRYDSSDADDLRSEFELLSRVCHPNIIRIIGYHVGQRHARLFLEWAAGGSLSDVMKGVNASSPPLSESQLQLSSAPGLHEDLVRSYVQQILSALQCLHEHGIIHRDLKPQNILADHMGVLRVTDFGLSRLLGDEASVVKTGISGTPRYMAPESVSYGIFSCGSDIWAVGATMSELLTGRLPWSHLNHTHALQLPSLLYHIQNFPGDHPIIPAHISDAAKDFMAQCFRQDPKERGSAVSLLQHDFFKREKKE